MRVFSALLLIVLSVVSYFVAAIQFGIRQDLPVIHILLGLTACAFLFREAVRAERTSQRWIRSAAVVFGLFLVSGFIWFTVVASAYSKSGPAAIQGQSVPELASLKLERHDGQVVEVISPTGSSKATLLVLYRGYW